MALFHSQTRRHMRILLSNPIFAQISILIYNWLLDAISKVYKIYFIYLVGIRLERMCIFLPNEADSYIYNVNNIC